MEFVVVQSVSHVQFFAVPWILTHQDPLSPSPPKVCSNSCPFESVMLSINHLILCHTLLLSSVFPNIRAFSNESTLHIRWAKYWSFRFSINPSNEYSGLISLRIELFDLLAVQGTLSLLQNHNLKAPIL